MDITIDLETIPTQKAGAYEAIMADVCANFKAPSTLTKEQAAVDLGLVDKDEIKFTSKDTMIKRWETELASVKVADVAEEKYRKTALSGSTGEIVVIGFKFGDEKAESFSRQLGEPEPLLVSSFYDRLREVLTYTHGAVEQVKFIGHNIQGFDLRFLWQRSVINNIKPPIDLLYSQYSDKVFDTMTTWAGFGNRISLKDLCAALGVPSPKDEIDGSMVWDYVKTGRVNEVEAYCRDGDVEATYQCYQKMKFLIANTSQHLANREYELAF